MVVPLDEALAPLLDCMVGIIDGLKLVRFAAGYHRSCVPSTCCMLKCILKRSLLALLNDLYWLYAPIYQCYLLQARPLIFNPSNLYFVHRVAIAEHYAGGVLNIGVVSAFDWC